MFSTILYPVVIKYLSKNKKLSEIKCSEKVTVIVPTYNEEKYIERKINNLLLSSYPKMDIFVVDNNSTDKTVEIVKKLPVKLFFSERGKIAAINKGIKNSKSDIIIITDADTTTTKETVSKCVNLLTKDIGAVNAICQIKDKIKGSYSKEKLSYNNKDWILRYLEGKLDSTICLDGKFIAFRKKIFPKFPKKTLADDYELVFFLKRKGYRSIVCKSARVFEEPPVNTREELKQISRRMGLNILINFRNIDFLFNPKYSYYGFFIFPFRRFFPLFFPIFIAYIALYLLIFFSWAGFFLVVIGLVCIFLIKRYMFIQLVGVTLAWIEILTGKIKTSGIWDKIRN